MARSRIRVLHLISTLDPGGAEQSLFRLVTSMDRTAFENNVVCMTRPGIVGQWLQQSGIEVQGLDMAKGWPDPGSVLRLRSVARMLKPDIVQCWMYHANLLGLTLLNPARTVWNIRCSDMDLSRYGAAYRLSVSAGAALSRFPSVTVVNSLAGRDVHTRLGYHPRRWELIPNGFDTALFRPDRAAGSRVRSELDIPADAFVIGLVARFDPMKDHETFFRAALMFPETSPPVHFILAGKGLSPSNRSIMSLVGNTRQRDRFHLLDERRDIPDILNAFDVAASSSLSEGLPNAIGEAMATGVPCVVTDAGDSAVLVGDTGSVVPRGCPGILSAAWKRLLDKGPDFRRSLGKQARQRIVDHYGMASMVSRYEKLYEGIISAREK